MYLLESAAARLQTCVAWSKLLLLPTYFTNTLLKGQYVVQPCHSLLHPGRLPQTAELSSLNEISMRSRAEAVRWQLMPASISQQLEGTALQPQMPVSTPIFVNSSSEHVVLAGIFAHKV